MRGERKIRIKLEKRSVVPRRENDFLIKYKVYSNFSEIFLSLLSFHLKFSLSSSHFLSALSSLCALSAFLGFLLKHETGWLGLAGVVVVDSVAWASRSRPGFADLFLLSSSVMVVNGVGLGLVNGVGLGLVNGVSLGLEVVEPCQLWVFFSF